LIAFEKIVLPISEQFNPEIIFVCAGFDAADQGPFTHVGGYKVTPHGYLFNLFNLFDLFIYFTIIFYFIILLLIYFVFICLLFFFFKKKINK